MSDITLQPDQLRQAANVFSGAGKDTQEILKKLDDTSSELEKHWDGVNQQVFFSSIANFGNIWRDLPACWRIFRPKCRRWHKGLKTLTVSFCKGHQPANPIILFSTTSDKEWVQ